MIQLLLSACAILLFAVWPVISAEADKSEKPAPHNTLSQQEIAEGWISLFDGETLFGWAPGSKADWRVADGAISVTSGEAGLLHTTSQFDNFVLRGDFRAPKETNSGIFLRTAAAPKSPTVDCYEANIADPSVSPFPTGSLVGRKKGTVEKFSTDWQTYEIRVDGDRFTVKLNGAEVCDYTDPKPLARGFIGLQLNSGKAEFRDIKLKPLGLKKLLDRKDLSGWKAYPGKPIKTEIADGVLHASVGPGQLESDEKFGDFTLAAELKCNAKNVNSGIFFRCIPGDLMNGYECQVHNVYKGGDRSKPTDCGTGGIYRRQNARRVVANDLEWFHLTLVISGLHMAAWVNGYQVSDWSDPRSPDPNPRNGSRVTPGTLALQLHDPTTDISVRSIDVAEMRK